MKKTTESRTYLWTALTLLVLLALTVGAAYLNLGPFNLPVALAIAAAKAWLILSIFMNTRRSNQLIRVTAATGFFWLLIFFVLALSDFLTRF